MTIPEKSRRLVIARAGGRCELCRVPAVHTHHRRPRGAGGSRDHTSNLPANLLRLCCDCHGLIESRRTWAYDLGLLVHQGHDPARVPVRLGCGWVWLDNRGSVTPCTPPSGTEGASAA